MASPHVAGVAALIWSHYPTKTAQEVRAALTASAKDLGAPGRDNYYGHGLVQADKALQFLGAGLTADPTASPTPAPTVFDDCNDSPAGWIDSYGDGCEWYEQYEQPGCPYWGHVTDPTNGVPATEACCHCKDDSDQCSDVPNWKDAWGGGCDWYTSPYICDIYSSYPGYGGLTVTQACCACGGGV